VGSIRKNKSETKGAHQTSETWAFCIVGYCKVGFGIVAAVRYHTGEVEGAEEPSLSRNSDMGASARTEGSGNEREPTPAKFEMKGGAPNFRDP